VLPKSIQLLAGRTGREYNLRKKRKGGFGVDRYHATAVQDGQHLVKCRIYIDMNMVRTGVVKHPSEWNFCGYNEILNPPKRYTLIDNGRLIALCGYSDNQKFQANYKSLIDDEIKKDNLKRDDYWTESIAVGTKDFILDMKISLGALARGRKISSDDKVVVPNVIGLSIKEAAKKIKDTGLKPAFKLDGSTKERSKDKTFNFCEVRDFLMNHKCYYWKWFVNYIFYIMV
jgi:putative transposase